MAKIPEKPIEIRKTVVANDYWQRLKIGGAGLGLIVVATSVASLLLDTTSDQNIVDPQLAEQESVDDSAQADADAAPSEPLVDIGVVPDIKPDQSLGDPQEAMPQPAIPDLPNDNVPGAGSGNINQNTDKGHKYAMAVIRKTRQYVYWVMAACLVLLILLLASCWMKMPSLSSGGPPVMQDDIGKTAFLTSLPIFMAEAASVEDALAQSAKGQQGAHPLRAFWQETINPQIHDDLAKALANRPDFLLLAQPRPFTPEEFAQFDAWIVQGGKALIFADPALFWPSIYPIGDVRRPEGVTLMSPLFAYWGLEQRIDEDQPEGVWAPREYSPEILVVQAGHFAVIESGPDSAVANCALSYDALVATCKRGKGRAVFVADADMLQADFYPLTGDEDASALPSGGNWPALDALLRIAAL